LVLFAAGCSGALRSSAPPTQVYVLRAAARPESRLKETSVSLHINRPIAAPGLDSDHIVLVQSDHRMSHYIGSRWPAALPSVVEELAVDTLRSTGAWSSVQDSGSAFPADYLLQIVIRRFEADYSANPSAPEVHVLLDCTLGRRAGRDIQTSFIASGSATASENRMAAVVTAFESAAAQAMSEIAQKVESPVPSITR
jgi:ABC-type uncharacterized transport system auxiliary subunit